jgi:hypothetical protein
MDRLARGLVAAVGLAVAFALPAAGPAGAVETVAVSDERTITYWAPVAKEVAVRAAPARTARRVGALRRHTFYRFREIVIVLRDTREGRRWTLVRYPGLGRRTGWVPSEALGARRHTDRQIVIDRARTRLTVLKAGERLFTTRVGVGGPSSPTPAGRTYLRERLLPAPRDGIYGVLAFGLSAYSPFRTDWPGGGQVGIHGTNQPHLIPGRISNGCVRLRNRAIRRVDRLTGVGTPVLVR